MKKIALAAIAISLLATPAAFAQQRHDNGKHYSQQQKHVVKKRIVTKKTVVRKTRWSRGHALPSSYRRNVVRDYHRYHLKTPPRGYHWVKADNDYVLIGITSGIISALVQAR
ncbi:MAG: RcnB family protein [Phyllobacterium sp.]